MTQTHHRSSTKNLEPVEQSKPSRYLWVFYGCNNAISACKYSKRMFLTSSERTLMPLSWCSSLDVFTFSSSVPRSSSTSSRISRPSTRLSLLATRPSFLFSKWSELFLADSRKVGSWLSVPPSRLSSAWRQKCEISSPRLNIILAWPGLAETSSSFTRG